MNGERSQVVKAEVCGSSTRGFNSHRSPLNRTDKKGLLKRQSFFGLGFIIQNTKKRL